MIHVIASIKVKEDYLDAFIKIFKANVPNVLGEKGCLGYEPCRDMPTGLPIQDTDVFTVTIVVPFGIPGINLKIGQGVGYIHSVIGMRDIVTFIAFRQLVLYIDPEGGIIGTRCELGG